MKAEITFDHPSIARREGEGCLEHARVLLTPENPADQAVLNELVEDHRLGAWQDTAGGAAYVEPKLLGGGFW